MFVSNLLSLLWLKRQGERLPNFGLSPTAKVDLSQFNILIGALVKLMILLQSETLSYYHRWWEDVAPTAAMSVDGVRSRQILHNVVAMDFCS